MNRHALGAVLAGFLGGVAGAVGGCNFIVGAGDYSVGDASTGIIHAEAGKPRDGGKDGSKDTGANGDGGLLGDPCESNVDCVQGTCDGEWCTQPCKSNASCGTNSIGEKNYCGQNGDGEFICIPGCTTLADCINFEGTTCQQIAGGTPFVCTPSSDGGVDGGSGGITGDPCSDDAGCAVGTCNGASWCYTSCASVGDPSCGSNSVGEANFCAVTDTGFDCFPTCQANVDCLPYLGTTCQPQPEAGVDLCGGTFGVIGDPCDNVDATWTDCTDAGTEQCNGVWCTAQCASATDPSCGVSSTGQPNHCLNITKDGGTDGGFECVPGCATNDDCVQYEGFCDTIEGGANNGVTFCGN